MIRLLQSLLNWAQPAQIARYRPAPRLGTRQLERRLLREVRSHLASTATIRS